MQPARRGECAPIVHSRRRAEDCPPYQVGPAIHPWLQRIARAIGRDFNPIELRLPRRNFLQELEIERTFVQKEDFEHDASASYRETPPRLARHHTAGAGM